MKKIKKKQNKSIKKSKKKSQLKSKKSKKSKKIFKVKKTKPKIYKKPDYSPPKFEKQVISNDDIKLGNIERKDGYLMGYIKLKVTSKKVFKKCFLEL